MPTYQDTDIYRLYIKSYIKNSIAVKNPDNIIPV